MSSSLASGIESTISIFATALFDWSVALATGSLLAAHWLRSAGPASPSAAIRVPRMRSAALLMLLALAAQFYLLVAMMTGQAGFADVLNAAPLVATTHAGRVTLATLGVALVLLVADLVKALRAPAVFASLVVLILLLHSATGHAASDGDFTLAELLQFLHLAGIALWTGGVIVSGLFLVPKLLPEPSSGSALPLDPLLVPLLAKAYLRALSRVSTGAVALVLLTGAYKGWTGLDHQLSGLLYSGWGRILLSKLGLVAVALALGALHRCWVRQPERAWTPQQTRTLAITLRLEAVALTLVLLLSAWLGSVDPGM